jgi:hypothetical protein
MIGPVQHRSSKTELPDEVGQDLQP